jgi:hypothetical protein
MGDHMQNKIVSSRETKMFSSEYQLEQFLIQQQSNIQVCSTVYYSSTEIKLNYIMKGRVESCAKNS